MDTAGNEADLDTSSKNGANKISVLDYDKFKVADFLVFITKTEGIVTILYFDLDLKTSFRNSN